jgi:hypothetical protein
LDDEKFDEKFKNTRLFFTDNKNAWRLQNNETLYPSDFARYIKITEATNTTTWNIASPDLLIKIESHVLYKRSWKTWEIILESLMWKIR